MKLWNQVIEKALADLKSGGIYGARDAYEFFFSPASEADLKLVCSNANREVETVRREAMEIHIPLRVRLS